MRQSASFFNRSRIMTSSQPAVSPLRQRMIDDMRMRQLAPKTQANYLRIVREFARFLERSPDTATVTKALLRNSARGETTPNPRRIYATATVCGRPSG
jgi:hypothetical protein